MDDDQQFCLRWNNHQSTLISVFDTLLENGTLVDCTLAAEGKFLKAHKVVLSACSPYFASLLSQQYDKHPIFILKDVKFQELRAMMDYMYRGEVNISQDQLAALLKAAESLQIKGLSDSRSGGTASGSGGGGGGGGSSGGNNAGQKQPTNEHKQMPVPASVIGKGGSSSGYTLEQKRSRHAMGGSSIESQELSGSREGSSSPTSRKRKKMRRRSLDNIMADNHEHSNSSSHSLHVNSSVPPSNTSTAIPPVPTIVATSSSSLPTTSISAAVSGGSVAGLNVTKKTEIVSNTTKLEGMEHDMDNDNEDDDDDNQDENEKPSGHGKKEQNHKRNKSQHIDTDNGKDNMLIEPKSEYDDGNDENVEDLTLDEEELLDDLEQAGPSHGGGEGSSQEYAQWQVDRSQDEVFMPAQEAAGQQRDPQVSTGSAFSRIRVRNWLMMTDQATNCITDEQKNLTTPTNAITTNDNNTKQDNISQHENEENVNNTGVGVVGGGGGISSDVIVKIEHSSPSPSIYNNNSENSNQTPTDFNYDLKISSPISWAFEPIKTEKSQNATTTIYAVKKTRKSSSSRSTSTISSTSVKSPIGGRINLRTKARVLQNQLTNSTSASEKKYRILFQNQRIRKESLEHSEDMIYNSEYEKPWICRNCNRNYKWKNSLKCHLKNECGQPPRFFCNKMCGYRTNVHSNLKRHLNTKCKNRDDESTQQ